MSLTAEEKTAVQDTWGVVAKDLKGNSIKVFLHFFTMFPEYQKLFRGFADTPMDQLPENRRFKAHAFTVVSAINGLIDNLDDPEMLCELLVKTGQNHAKRSIKIGDFKNLNDCLMDLFSKIFGEAWTPVAKSGWSKVFSVVLEKVAEGLKLNE
ncbi:globin [Folsomia candida]|uniref:Globin n=1 Tax=Folsomia candida TaxID=158441 RepID=A0A226EJA5_FOLCA|nr:globin [Folsomia candida]OXA57298.1 Globin [Folsomia candida]